VNINRLVGLVILMFLWAQEAAPSEIPYGTGTWDAGVYGNHRALIMVSAKADAVFVRIPWRRRDLDPEHKNIVILDAATQARVRNLSRMSINREYGDLVFQPVSGPGVYAVYYLINHMEGRSNYPTVTYPAPEDTADDAWMDRNGLTGELSAKDIRSRLHEASVVEFQSIDELHSFDPMEVIATAAELNDLLVEFPDAEFLAFPEDRRFPIRMTRDLPRRWMSETARGTFCGEAARGEYYAFQIGVFACRADLEDVDVVFSGLTCPSGGSRIGPELFTCFNTEGVDWKGRRFRKTVSVPKGKVQALWCGLKVPSDIPPGDYSGLVKVDSQGAGTRTVKLRLTVSAEALEDAGDSEPWRHSRLRWLNSRLALDEELIAPYTPLEVKGRLIRCLGRTVRLGELGFPQQIDSFFTSGVTGISSEGRHILAGPVRVKLQDGDGREMPWENPEFRFDKKAPGVVEWIGKAAAGSVRLGCRARMEPEGFLDFQVRVSAERAVDVSDIALVIPFEKSTARYMLGMGVRGGGRPAEFHWRWDSEHNQDSVWLGDVNAGLQCSLRDDRYSRPLNTNFYLLKPLVMPKSWWNAGQGGCSITEPDEGGIVNLRAFSGPRRLEEGDVLHFNFSLLITPFRPINPQAQWATRFYHRYAPVTEIASAGANTINVHHATEINPFINYPFLRPDAMKDYIDLAHGQNMRVKIYYTVRELSNRAPELFALRSLGDEIFFPGKGGGFSWLQEHLDADYIAAWFVPDLQDAAVINSGVSRWHNYYVEGLSWLLRNVGIDGLYIDDVAFDRTVMKRVRKVLDRNRPGALIDLHSANQFNPRDGYANSANLYMEHFPYIDRLWFGEYFDYDAAPEYWLVEVSGIPFGLMGEMLQDGGNPWRGMLFGMTSRLPWAGDPRKLWEVWDAFGIQDADMIGFWSEDCPVTTDHPKVLATVYAQQEQALVSLASWADIPTKIRLNVDWNSLGFSPRGMELRAPGIPDFQAQRSFSMEDAIPVAPGRGWLLILSKTNE
jgi:hypothetical protein